ncbi:MAG: SUMF1/EgtB/PvdO family nonheme iron enzyme [Candidatus Tenebribacter burtonii]|nr:SUMF1/EgtB/PvdO family nonheme iron enzyme [Candidatus Tenebribacter burtonii]
MVLVKGGTFQMGNIDGGVDEKPVHTVTLDSFRIGRYLITQSEYEEIMGNNPSLFQEEKVINLGLLGIGRKVEKTTIPMNPVESVNWYSAVEFCNRKSRKDGLTPCYSGFGLETKCDFTANGYRLPTEAEWEYAAQGGRLSKGYKYSGSNNINEVAWHNNNSGSKTHEVGTKQSNELKIYDMSGNVWEWCNDWYAADYYKKGTVNNPQGASSGSYRVHRGGSWSYYAEFCRVTIRSGCNPDDSGRNLGFRLLRSSK